MRIQSFGLIVLGLAAAGLVSACAGDSTPEGDETTSNDGARVIQVRPGASGSNASRLDLVRGFLKTNADLRVADELPGAGVSHVRFEQYVDGLRVHGAYVKAAVNERNELTHVIAKLAPAAPAAAPSIAERDALGAALRGLGLAVATPAQVSASGNAARFARGSLFHRDPSVERVAYVDDGGAVRQGFLVETWVARNNQLDETLVAGNGDVVSTERRTQNDSYRVFVEDPGKGGQVVVSGPAAGSTVESPAGWLGAGAQRSTDISGNNVRAYIDAVSDNVPDPGGTAVGDGNFLATADLSQSPGTAANLDVATQNLFYLNNLVHDRLYAHGFDEAAGNFQADNFGRGGKGGDAVNAEAQDGGGLDNANFATPRDGSAPRMQMFLWSGSSPSAEVTAGGSSFGAFASAFGPGTTADGAGGALAVVDDGTGAASDGCEASPAGSLAGKVAVVDRGTCSFTIKVKNAQLAGAVAVVIANNQGGDTGAFGPGGDDATITIPSAMVTQNAGAALKALAGAASNLHTNPAPPLRIDSDLDSDIVFHEYGHGLSWRMIGNMSGPLSGALGEGASDVLAFLLNGDPTIGEYSSDSAAGIRRFPYEGYPLTLKDVTGAGVHNDGEIYAAAMWKVRGNYVAAGLTADDTLHDFVQGMNFTPAGPAFQEMRDGMLQATAGNSVRQCAIWRGFAAQGIGVGAKTVKKGSKIEVTESFALPAECQ
ncbi:MAG TPA: M36 family metallopeptidase [Polyangiaceae bacterium]|nr:M36 family metallopeptidase [Polyangiaceae bacterium]